MQSSILYLCYSVSESSFLQYMYCRGRGPAGDFDLASRAAAVAERRQYSICFFYDKAIPLRPKDHSGDMPEFLANGSRHLALGW